MSRVSLIDIPCVSGELSRCVLNTESEINLPAVFVNAYTRDLKAARQVVMNSYSIHATHDKIQ